MIGAVEEKKQVGVRADPEVIYEFRFGAVGRDVNLELLHAQLEAEDPQRFLGLSIVGDQLTAYYDEDDEIVTREDEERIRGAIQRHDPAERTPRQRKQEQAKEAATTLNQELQNRIDWYRDEPGRKTTPEVLARLQGDMVLVLEVLSGLLGGVE